MSANLTKLWVLVSFVQIVHPLPPVSPVALGPTLGAPTLARTAQHYGTVLRNTVPALLVALLAIHIIVIPLSPSPHLGISETLKLLAVIAAIVLATATVQTGRKELLRVTMLAISPFAVIQPITTIAFRISTQLETTYLNSGPFGLLLGSPATESIHDEWFNILEPFKSGGLFFHNANRASMVMAVIGLLYLAVWWNRNSFLPMALSLLNFTGMAFAGSKTSLVLAATLIPLALILPGMLRKRGSIVGKIEGWGSLLVLMTVAGFLAARAGELIQGADQAVGQREALFAAAYSYFKESPVFGLGFGGWFEHWEQDAMRYGLDRPTLPPHNFLIAEWSSTGIIGALIVVFVFVRLAVDYLKLIARSASAQSSRALAAMLCALMWIALHGMFDATDFFGSDNTIPLFAVLVVQTFTHTNDTQLEPLAPTTGASRTQLQHHAP